MLSSALGRQTDEQVVEVQSSSSNFVGTQLGINVLAVEECGIEEQLLAWVANLHLPPPGAYEDGDLMNENVEPGMTMSVEDGETRGASMTDAIIQSPRTIEPNWRVRMSELVQKLLGDKPSRNNLFGQTGPMAQRLLDGLQKLIDIPELINDDVKQLFLQALLRLCAASGMYPRCLALRGVHSQGQPLTAGTFGEIWQGRFGDRVVCLKVVKLYQNSEVHVALKKFIKEAIVWSHLIHLNVLPFYGIYHLGDGTERVCLVSPWMEHGNITTYLRAHPNAPRMRLILEIIEGLEYLHQKGIIHGDLKGDNILINTSGSAYIADFGLSSVLDSELSPWSSWKTSVHTCGTVRWMAPEIVEGGVDGTASPFTTMADVYSLGSVIYEVITGRIPYHGKKGVTVMLRVIQGRLPERNLSISNEMWDLIQWCWKYSPKDRPEIWQVRTTVNLLLGHWDGSLLLNEQATEEMNSYLSFRSTFRNAIYGRDKELSYEDMEPFLEILQGDL